jgi:hypothetical protein
MRGALIAFALLLSLASGLFAQPQRDSLPQRDENDIDNTIEDAIIDSGTDDQTDWTFMTDNLQDLREHPLNINTVDPELLIQLPGMNPILVNNIMNHIREFGKLTTIYELQAVPGFSAEIFRLILPYVTVKESQAKDINPGVLHPAGPSLRTVLDEGKHELILRTSFTGEQERGYQAPNDSTPAAYAGNGARYYTRYRMRYNQNFSMALVGEKDSGEEFIWNPQKGFYGFDYLAGHVAVRDYGRLKRLVVGDFNVQAGQGLILSTGLGFGKGSDAVNAVKRQNLGILPYASVNENQFMRGAATTVAFGKVYATGFASRNALDASVDSTVSSTGGDVDAFASSLQTSGLHRTRSEIANKDAIRETAFGGRLEYKDRWLQVGMTHLQQQYDVAIQSSQRDYAHFDFTGKTNYLTGIDFDATYRNANFFGEIARSRSGGIGGIGGVLASLTPKVDVTVLVRSFDADFHTTKAFSFSERPTATQNEQGIYMGMRVSPSSKWIFSTFFDQFRFNWHKYNTAFPSRGHEFLGQLDYKPSRALGFQIRFRSDSKETNANIFPDSQQVEMLVPTNRKALRFQLSYKLSPNISIRTRVEQSWWRRGYETAPEELAKGFIAYQDLSWKVGYKWKFTGRFAVFDAVDYDARIYAYENDVLGFFSVPAYYGVGSRYYAIVQFSPNRAIDIWGRVSRSTFYNEKTVGSSQSEIDGNRRTEIKLQVRFLF